MKNFLKGILSVVLFGAVAISAVGCSGDVSVPQWIEQQTCNHEWGNGEVTKEPTCTEKGEKTFTCEKCEKTKTEAMEKAEHRDIVRYEEAATCTEDGKKLYECEDCGALHTDVIKAAHVDEDENLLCDTCGESLETPETEVEEENGDE